jgi:hypothetical protein
MLDMYDFLGDIWLCHSYGGVCYNYTAFVRAPSLNLFLSLSLSIYLSIYTRYIDRLIGQSIARWID